MGIRAGACLGDDQRGRRGKRKCKGDCVLAKGGLGGFGLDCEARDALRGEEDEDAAADGRRGVVLVVAPRTDKPDVRIQPENCSVGRGMPADVEADVWKAVLCGSGG